jgi:hypothetical protein
LVNNARRITHRNNSILDGMNHNRTRAYRGARTDRSHCPLEQYL